MKSLQEKGRFVQRDRRGALKKYHEKEDRSMREVAALKAEE